MGHTHQVTDLWGDTRGGDSEEAESSPGVSRMAND